MPVTYPTKLVLAHRSGDVCALPGCGQRLTRDSESGSPGNFGEAAHIVGEKEGSARYERGMTDRERNDHDNLIYLCANCHRIIDDPVNGERNYPIGRLKRIKSEHEKRIHDAVVDAFPDVGFPELSEAVRWIDENVDPRAGDGDFLLVSPRDKLNKNELGRRSEVIVVSGLSVAREVRRFVEFRTQTDRHFPERLKAGFLIEYHRLKKMEELSADELFDLMCRFAQRGLQRQIEKTAGLAVLVYLFEACEVFEK